MTRDLNIALLPLEFGNFTGINNVEDAVRISNTELSTAVNVDLSDAGIATRRDGYVSKVALSGAVHSLWSDNRMCLYVDDGVLKRLFPDYTVSTLRSGVSNYPMSYTVAPNSPDKTEETIYYTNANVNGYVNADGVSNTFAVPTQEFKTAPPVGQHIAYYNARLYIGQNQTLWYTDAGALGRVTIRSNWISLEDEITMLEPVDNGLWISTGDQFGSIFFLSGSTPESFVRIRRADYGVIQGTAVRVENAESVLGDIGIQGTAIIFAMEHGICVGGNGGQFINLTYNKYKLIDNRFGSGLLRINNNKASYIATTWA